jgi:hypothetical protein
MIRRNIMSVFVLDAGNSIIKAKVARRELGEITFPHALQQITDAEYLKILSRSRPQDFHPITFGLMGNLMLLDQAPKGMA